MKNKWTVLALLCGIFVVYTVDRALLGLLAIPIKEDMGLTNIQIGVLNSAIFWAYALAAPFTGLAGDRFDRVRLIAAAVIAWSAMAILAGFAGGFWSLLVLVSVAIVLPQTIYSPTASALISSLHTTTRTVAMSCHQAAFYTGWVVSGAAVAAILSLFGTWRAAFFVFGAIGLVLGLLFVVLNRGRDVSSLKEAESSSDATGASRQRNPPVRQYFRAFFGCPSAMLAAVGYVTAVFVSCGYCAWGPMFVAQKFGISPAVAGTGVMFWHYAASFAAILAAGAVTDRFVRRWPRFRLTLSLTAMTLAIPFLLLFARAGSQTLAFAGAALLGMTLGVLGANQFTNLFDVIPSAFRAGSIGFLNFIAVLAGSLSPILLGALSEARGVSGFEAGFSLMAFAFLIPMTTFLVSIFKTFRQDRIAEG